jgi:putative metallohydrolase (TIGR04338 family)
MTDIHKLTVYDAEKMLRATLSTGGRVEVAGSVITAPIERNFGNLDNVTDYIERLHTLFGQSMSQPPRVRVRKGQKMAHYETFTNTIAVPVKSRWALRETVVLHEYAHALTWHKHRVTGHGPFFQEEFETLLTDVIGPEAGWLLRTYLHMSAH